MLRMAVNVALFGAFLLMVLVFGFFLWQTLFASEEHGGREAQGKPAYSEQQSSNEQAFGSSSAPSAAKSATDEAIAEYTKWLAIFTMFLVLATIGLFVSGERNVSVTRQSADAARKAADVAEGTLVATNRPWASVAKIEIAGPLTFQNGEGKVPLTVALKNLGHSPAIRVSVNVKLVLSNTTNLLAAQKEYCDHFRKPLPPGGIRPELTLWPGDQLVFPVDAWMNSQELPAFKEWADRTPFPIALIAIIGCIDYEFSFGEGHHQTALIYDLHKIKPYPRERFGDIYSEIPGAVLLEGQIPMYDLMLKMNFVGTGPID
jgi:hypothetical protein